MHITRLPSQATAPTEVGHLRSHACRSLHRFHRPRGAAKTVFRVLDAVRDFADSWKSIDESGVRAYIRWRECLLLPRVPLCAYIHRWMRLMVVQ